MKSSPSIDLSPSLQEADDAFERLRSLDPNRLWDEGAVRIRGTLLGREMSVRLSPDRQVNAASDHFHWHQRIRSRYRSHEAPSAVLNEHSTALATMDASKVRAFVRAMTYVPGQFNPAIARAILEDFSAERVLDPCAGWGDRLAGALASSCVKEYVGVDPNRSLQSGYAQQIKRYCAEGKAIEVLPGAFEDVTIKADRFDLAFTSPPYFDTEHYSDDPDQSDLRYPRVEQWVSIFLVGLLTKAVRSVRPGGHVALNLANVNRMGRLIPLAEIACDVMESRLGCAFTYAWGMRINDRQHVGSLCEPILVWEKPHGR